MMMRTVNRNYSYRAYPTKEQGWILEKQALAARYLWNLIHDTWTFRKSIPPFDYLTSEIKNIRKEVDWLGVLPAQAAQAVFRTYFQAWKNCWNIEHPADAPCHKTRKSKLAVDIPQGRDLNLTKINSKYSTVQVPKLGKLKVRLHNSLDSVKITGARLVKQQNGWHITVRCQVQVASLDEKAPDMRPAVGIDRGITLPLALSDGTTYVHEPFLTIKEKERKLRLERRAARQERARKKEQRRISKRHRRNLERVASFSAREARRRKDWHHKVSRDLAVSYSMIALEDLKTKNMTKSAKGTIESPGTKVTQKRGLNRAILNEGWSALLVMLTYKMAKNGGCIELVRPHYTSQECSTCGERGKRDSQAVFFCTNPQCELANLEVNADINAALNILTRGLEQSCLDASWVIPTARQTLTAN